MKKITLLFVLVLTFWGLNAQTSTNYTILPQRPFKVDPAKPDTSLYIKNLEAPNPYDNFDKHKAAELKKIISAKYPRQNAPPSSRSTQPSSDTLTTNNSFYANPYNLRVPSDNSMAISDSGIVVSCINSSYRFYRTDTVGTIGLGSLEGFSEKIGHSVYDPKVIYDPKEDKFIVVMLKDFSSVDTNEIVVAFSSTNDPMDDWYVYSITGNPFDSTQWSDYPAISITDNELFITVNLIADTSTSWITGFQETIIWQVNKTDGYTNQPLNTKLWSDLNLSASVKIRNLHPVGNYDDYVSYDNSTHTSVKKQYFLSNKNLVAKNDTIVLVEISDEIGNNPVLTTTVIHTNLPYFFPVNGQQPNTPWDLLTNDSRVLGAIYNQNNDLIQFVQNSTDSSSGNGCVYHGMISAVGTSPVCTGQLISQAGVDYGYPNIASSSVSPNDNSAIICYNYSSDSLYPGHEATLYDDAGTYSIPHILKEGSNRIFVLTNQDQRWGDYSGIQRRYNEPGTVWFEGIYGKSSGTYGNWISEVFKAGPEVLSTKSNVSESTNSSIYPNPTNDLLWFNFEMKSTANVTVEVYDIRGIKVASIGEENVKIGTNLLSLNTSFLAPGNYLLFLKDQTGTVVVSKHFIRSK